MTFEPLTFGYFVAVLFVAYLVRGVAGFGSALIAVPLLSVTLPVTLTVPLVVSLDVLGSASQGVKNRRSIRWSELWPLLPFTVCGIAAALYLLTSVQPQLLSKALALFVVVYAVYQLLPLPPLRATRAAALPFGALGGLVGTLFATGGPFYVMYLTLRGLGSGEFRASSAVYFLIDGSLRLFGYLGAGLYGGQTLAYLLLGLPAAAAGLWLGGRLHTSLSRKTFLRIISTILLAGGVLLWFKY